MADTKLQITEYAQLLMFTEAYDSVNLRHNLYGDFTESNRPQFNRFLKSFKTEIDHKKTLEMQSEYNKSDLQGVRSKIYEEKNKIKTIQQDVKTISKSKRELHKLNQQLNKLLKQKKQLDEKIIIKKGRNVWYRASPDTLLVFWGVRDKEYALFFRELIQLKTVDECLFGLNNEIYNFYRHKMPQPYVNAVLYMSFFYARFFKGLFSDIHSRASDKREAWCKKHEIRDEKGELIKYDPSENPFILTNEILEECMDGYTIKTKEFLKKWNLIALKMKIHPSIYSNIQVAPDYVPIHNMGVFNILGCFRKNTANSIRDPLRDKCEWAARHDKYHRIT